MTKHNFVFTTLACLVLSACSGGGSKSSSYVEKNTITEVPSVISGGTVTIISGVRKTEETKTPVDLSLNDTKDELITIPSVAEIREEVSDTPPTIEEKVEIVPSIPDPDLPTINSVNENNSVYAKNDNTTSSTWFVEQNSINFINEWGNNNIYNSIKLGENEERIELFPSSVSTNTLNTSDSALFKSLERGKYTLSGYIIPKETDNERLYYISQGKDATVELPTSGVFNYQGKGKHADYNAEEGYFVFKDSDVKFSADFANKTIRGEVSSPDQSFKTTTLGANMTQGNAFSGEVNGTILYGGFYGENADEITGAYNPNSLEGLNDKVLGVFNATKQE